jgi:hypothetical protein
MKRGGLRGVVLATLLAAACAAPAEEQEGKPGKPASWTMVIGVDVSGSFRDARLYDDAIEFASLYIYAHLNGLGGLRVPTTLFVSSVGGLRAGETKSFHPINDFTGRSPAQIAADLRGWFPQTDPYTDYNAFFQRVAGLVKERGLVLAPLNVVLLSDGVFDAPLRGRPAANRNPYTSIDLTPLEFLSRSVTVRVLYSSPTVGDNWKRQIPRKRVRIWTQEAQVMAGWHKQFRPGLPLERQDNLWKWVQDNVDFRARGGQLF